MTKLLIYLALIAIGCYRLQAQNIELSSINGANGLLISSVDQTQTDGNVNYAGDINKDGFNDVLLWEDYNLYVIYGNNGSSGVNLSNFTSSQGFVITEASKFGYKGTGDVNGDKIDDLMIANGNDNSVCVVFGSQLGFQDINLTGCGNETFGIQISGCPENYTGCNMGFAVSGAGDINGDNIQDMLISADLMGLPSSANRTQSGVVFVLYGSASGLSNINLTNLSSTQGFSIVGPAANYYVGETISKAGDVNGDGIDDIILGAYYGFPAYVIYGNTNGFSNMDLANFNSSQGFTISVANSSMIIEVVSNAGDVSGDQIDDLLIGVNDGSNGWGYVIYGSKSMPFNIALSNITPAQGFSIVSNQTNTLAESVSGLGDFNQDGLDDIAISAYDYNNSTGAAFVIFGTKSQPASISVDTLPSAQGIAIIGADLYEEAGYSVSGIGDFNGDNIPDIALGSHSDIETGYVVYSPYKNGPNPPGPKSAGRIGYKALIMSVVAFILCVF